jgi:hypothetical protein
VGGFRGKTGGAMKKQIVRILFAVSFIAFILTIPAGQAFASLVNTSASLNWSLLNIFGSLNWTSQTTATNATVSNSLGETGDASDLLPGWVSSSSTATISNAGAQGISNTPQSLSAVSYSSLADIGWSNSSGSSVLTGYFTATTTGWVIITVPYSVSMNLTASDDPTASAYGKTRASISLAQSGGSTSTDFIELFSTVYGGNTFGNSKSGLFGLMKYFETGETGTFTTEVFTDTATSSPVPLPGALWLFAPGLACFVGLRRRFRN